MDPSAQEALWVLRAQCGDRAALEQLLGSVQSSMHRYLRGIVGSTDADDVLQDVFVIAFQKLQWLEEPRLFRPWLFRIASRAALRHSKKRARRQESDDSVLASFFAPEERPPDDLLAGLSTSVAVSPASRAVLLLHFQEEMSLPDVAAVLGIPLGTVKSRLAYGLETLRKHLGNQRRT